MTVLDATSCELEIARKLFWLLANDYIFLCSYNDDKKTWDDGAYPAINCNDVFVPAADAENLFAEELDSYIDACKRFGTDAPIAWVEVKRNAKPWRLTPSSEETYREAIRYISNLQMMRKCPQEDDSKESGV